MGTSESSNFSSFNFFLASMTQKAVATDVVKGSKRKGWRGVDIV